MYTFYMSVLSLVLIIIAAVIVSGLIFSYIFMRYVSWRVYMGTLVRTSPDVWARACSEPENEEQLAREEAEKAMVELKTSGRKGVKLPRYNVAFAPDLYAYIQTMSRAAGQSYTEFINLCVRQHLNANKDKYDTARSFLDSLQ